MFNIRKKIALVLSLFVIALGLTPTFAFAAGPVQGAIEQGSCDAAGQTNCDPKSAGNTIDQTIKNVINILSVIVGVVAVIMIVVGGFRYITSGGDSTKVTAAKNTILYALIGLIIVALAQLIAKFVLGKASGK